MQNQPHPDLDLLDRLRAGLLDDQPDEKRTLEKHITDCHACQSQILGWEQLGQAALGPHLDAASVRNQLKAARRHALDSSRPPHQQPFSAYATAAMLLIAVSFGLWTWQLEPDTVTHVTAQNTVEVPDVYEDLDFYLWLATQDDNANHHPTGDPNNT